MTGSRIPLPPLVGNWGRQHVGRYLEIYSKGLWNLYEADGKLILPLNAFECRLVSAAIAAPDAALRAEMTAERLTRKAAERLVETLQRQLNDATLWRAQAEQKVEEMRPLLEEHARLTEAIDRQRRLLDDSERNGARTLNERHHFFWRGGASTLAALDGREYTPPDVPERWDADRHTLTGRYHWNREQRGDGRIGAALGALGAWVTNSEVQS